MTETKLKPCPFCGEETKLRIDDVGLNKRYYSCRVCLAYGPASVGEDGQHCKARTVPRRLRNARPWP